MKKRIWIIVSIVAVIALCTILPAVASLEKEKEFRILYWWSDGKNPNIDREYVDPNPEEKTLDLIALSETLDYTEVNDETLSSLAKLTLSLFDEYDKILVRRTFYTDRLEIRKKDSPTDHKTDKVVVYCENADDDSHALVFLGLMIELFDQDMYFSDQDFMKYNRPMATYLIISTNYKKMGFKTIDDYRKKIDQIGDEYRNIFKEMEKYGSKETPLTTSEASKYQKLEEKIEKNLDEKIKLNDGCYKINFERFTVTKKDGYYEFYNTGAKYIGGTKWSSVAELAEIE